MASPMYNACKLLFVGFLLVLFIVQAYQCIEKYCRGEIVFVSKYQEMKDLEPPAMTVCLKMDSAWNESLIREKNISTRDMDYLKLCDSYENADEVRDCIKRNTKTLQEVVDDLKTGALVDLPKSWMDPAYWTENVLFTMYGRCYTIVLPVRLAAHMLKSGVYMSLDADNKRQYLILIHDRKYLVMASNTASFPRIWLEEKDITTKKLNGKCSWYYLMAKQYMLMADKRTKDGKQCEVEESYDYLKCIKHSLAGQIGCSPGWDSYGRSDLPVCTSVEDLRRHQNMDKEIYNMEKKEIFRLTNCLPPCKYTEYNVIGEVQTFPFPFITDNVTAIGYNYVSTEVETLSEEELYPWPSLVSELGGSLGLFTGVSCLSLWDVMDIVLASKLANKMKNKP